MSTETESSSVTIPKKSAIELLKEAAQARHAGGMNEIVTQVIVHKTGDSQVLNAEAISEGLMSDTFANLIAGEGAILTGQVRYDTARRGYDFSRANPISFAVKALMHNLGHKMGEQSYVNVRYVQVKDEQQGEEARSVLEPVVFVSTGRGVAEVKLFLDRQMQQYFKQFERVGTQLRQANGSNNIGRNITQEQCQDILAQVLAAGDSNENAMGRRNGRNDQMLEEAPQLNIGTKHSETVETASMIGNMGQRRRNAA